MIADAVRMIRHCQSDQPGESLHLWGISVLNETIYSSYKPFAIHFEAYTATCSRMRLLHPYLLSFQATVSRQYISSLVLFQMLVCDLCVLCLSLRQRGDWGRQCRGQSERSIPAHY